MRLALAITFAILLAGCAAPDAPSPAAEGSGTSGSLPGGTGAEPHLHATPEGVLWLATIAGDPSPAIWRSDDAGVSWTTVALEVPTGTHDTSLAVTDDGRVWAASLAAAQGGAICTTVSMSEDGGATWSHNEDVCGQRKPTDRPWMATDGTRAHVLQRVSSALEHGATQDNAAWEMRPVPLVGVTAGPLGSARGEVAFAYSYGTILADPAPTRGLFVARTSDGGATWRTEPVSDETPTFRWPVHAKGEGAEGVVWLQTRDDLATTLTGPGLSESPGLPWDVRLAVRGDDAWGAPVTLDGGWNAHAWLSASGAHLAATWLHAEAQDGPWTLKVWRDGELLGTGVVHEGPLERSTFLDLIGSAVLPDGTVVVVIPDDEEGLRSWRFPPASA